jgi:hypothetical protein
MTTVVTLCTLYTFAQHTSNIVDVVLYVKLYSPANITINKKECKALFMYTSASKS